MNQCYYKCNHKHIKENYHEKNQSVYDNIYNNLYKYEPDKPKNLNIFQSNECKK